MARRSRWTFQPPVGTPIDRSHPQARGLVGFWPLSEPGGDTGFDAVGVTPITTAGDQEVLRNVTERGRAALTSDAGSDGGYFTAATNDQIETSLVSVSVWAKLTGTTGTFTGIAGKTASNFATGWGLARGTTAPLRFFVEGWNTNFAETTIPTDGLFHHYVGTWDGATVAIYLDGVLQDTDPYSGSITATHDLRIGKPEPVASDHWWPGYISDVRIYNRGLTPTEVLDLYVNPYDIYQSPRSSVFVSAAGAFTLTADTSAYAWTPQPATLAFNRTVSAASGAYAWAPQTVGLAFGRSVSAGAASYAWTPQAATLAFNRIISAATGAYAWTPQTAGLAFGRSVSAGAASYAWTGQTAGLAFDRVVSAGSGSYAWTPQTAGLAFGRVLSAAATSYTWTPQDATLTHGTAGAFTLTADATSYAWTPQTAGLALGRVVSAGSGSYAWTGQTAGLAFGRAVTADAGSYAWTGQAVTLRAARVLGAEAASFSWTPQTAGVLLGRVVSAGAGSYAWTPQTAGVQFGRRLTAEAVSYTWTGQDATLTFSGAAVLPGVGRVFTVSVTPRRFTRSI